MQDQQQDLKRKAIEDTNEIPQLKRQKIELIHDAALQLAERISALTNQKPSIKLSDKRELLIIFPDAQFDPADNYLSELCPIYKRHNTDVTYVCSAYGSIDQLCQGLEFDIALLGNIYADNALDRHHKRKRSSQDSEDDSHPQPKRRMLEEAVNFDFLADHISKLTNQKPVIKLIDHELVITFPNTIATQNSKFFERMCSEHTVLPPVLFGDSPIEAPIVLSELGPGVICKINSQEKICSFFLDQGFGDVFFVDNQLFIPSLLVDRLKQEASIDPNFGSNSNDLIPLLNPIYKMIGNRKNEEAAQVFEYLFKSLEDMKNSNLYKGLEYIKSIISGVLDYSKQEKTMESEDEISFEELLKKTSHIFENIKDTVQGNSNIDIEQHSAAITKNITDGEFVLILEQFEALFETLKPYLNFVYPDLEKMYFIILLYIRDLEFDENLITELPIRIENSAFSENNPAIPPGAIDQKILNLKKSILENIKNLSTPNQQQIDQYLNIYNKLESVDIKNFSGDHLWIEIDPANQYNFDGVIDGITVKDAILTVPKSRIEVLRNYCRLKWLDLSGLFHKMDSISQLTLCILNETKKMPYVELKPDFVISIIVYTEDGEGEEEEYSGYKAISECFTTSIPKQLISKIQFGISLVDAWKPFSENITATDLSCVMAMVKDNRPLEALITLEHIGQRTLDVTNLRTVYLDILKTFPDWTTDQLNDAVKLANESHLFVKFHSGKNVAQLVLEDIKKKIRGSRLIQQVKESISALAGQAAPDIKSDDDNLVITFNNVKPQELEAFSLITNLVPESINPNTIFTVSGNETISNFFTLLDLNLSQAKIDSFWAVLRQQPKKTEAQQIITETTKVCSRLTQSICDSLKKILSVSVVLNENHELLIKFDGITQKHSDYKEISNFFNSKGFKTICTNNHLAVCCAGHQQICDLFFSLKLIDEKNPTFIGHFYAAHQEMTANILIKELQEAIKQRQDLTPHHLLPIITMNDANKFDEALSMLQHLEKHFSKNVECVALIQHMIKATQHHMSEVAQKTQISQSVSHLMLAPPPLSAQTIQTKPQLTPKQISQNGPPGPRG